MYNTQTSKTNHNFNKQYNNIKISYNIRKKQYNKQYSIKQIHQLTTFKSHQTLQHQIIISKMESNMHHHKNRINNLQNDIYYITDQQHKIIKQFDQEKQKIKKSIQTTHLNQINQYLKKTQELQHQYKSLRQLEEKQAAYQQKIENMKKQLVDKQYKHHDNMNKEQKKQNILDDSLLENNNVNIKETKKNAAKMAKQIVIIDKDYNQDKNQELKAQLVDLQNQLEKLKKQRNQILSRRKQVKINTTINQQELEQYKAVGSLQKAKIKANKDKIQNLKKTIAVQIAKRQSKITDMKKQRQGNIKVLKLKLHRLQKQKQQLKVHGQKLKILGDTIMLQRQEVQNFFLIAMQATRKEVQSSQIKSNLGEKHYGQKVDIEELMPKDKQRIITNLYTKLALGPK